MFHSNHFAYLIIYNFEFFYRTKKKQLFRVLNFYGGKKKLSYNQRVKDDSKLYQRVKEDKQLTKTTVIYRL